ncbi:MAG: ArsA-related P-loop ATPase [Actinomycetota bacterium]|nr:ArsA-related P-loop ATPase [Actinomycetota bacterium]
MSNRSRLLLLSGTGGSGTTTVCAATAAELAAEGLAAGLVDASGDAASPEALAAVQDVVATTLGRGLGVLGADPINPAAWSGLPGLGGLAALSDVITLLADPSVDVVVVDCGPIARARGLVALPATMLRLLDAALSPRLAMWRSGDGDQDDASTIFDGLSAARALVLRMHEALMHEATTVRLVTEPDDRSLAQVPDAIAAFGVLGLAVDGVVANRMARKDEAPKAVLAGQERWLDDLRVAAHPVSAWKSTTRPRPVPKGLSPASHLPAAPRVNEPALTITPLDEEYALDVPLAPAAVRRARVGRSGTELVIEFDGAHRWVTLPALLQRCRAAHATRTDGGLRISFVPDPAVWRAPQAGPA